MKLLLLPASSKIPLEHFNDSVKNTISIEKIKEFVNDEVVISNLDQSNSLWGFKKTEILERIWNSINENDIALFLSKGEFYYQASIGKKFASESLAKEIWGTDKDDKSWELIFTLKNGSQNPEFTWDYIKKEKGYKKNDRLQGPRYIDYIHPPANTDINKYISEVESNKKLSQDSNLFELGELYKRSELHDKYGGNRQVGIANCPKEKIIFIFSYIKKNQDVYVDEWKGDYFYYSGEGRIGDMTLTAGNKAIWEHEENGKEIHLFEEVEKNSGYMKYIDQLVLVDINYYRNKDDNGDEREAFQFVLLSTTKETLELNKNEIERGSLILKPDKPPTSSIIKTKRKFKGRKPINYVKKTIKDKKVGYIGEVLVLNYEKEKLSKVSRKDLANKVEHTSQTVGDGTGYDIKSYDEKGNVMYIEVKTTQEGLKSDFFMSPKEIDFSRKNENSYYLYRLYDLELQPKPIANFYIERGDISNHYNAEPTEYKMKRK
tara:strand:+ start:571 stop:2037 length:1467 start_codon:yes stop_codon:yes gene_type:complete